MLLLKLTILRKKPIVKQFTSLKVLLLGIIEKKLRDRGEGLGIMFIEF